MKRLSGFKVKFSANVFIVALLTQIRTCFFFKNANVGSILCEHVRTREEGSKKGQFYANVIIECPPTDLISKTVHTDHPFWRIFIFSACKRFIYITFYLYHAGN